MKSPSLVHSVLVTGGDVIGTIDLTFEKENSHSYLNHSPELLSGAPVSAPSVRHAGAARSMHVKHLAAELRNLNAQIDSMVSQVENAICRLSVRD